MKELLSTYRLYQLLELSNDYETDALSYSSIYDFDKLPFDYYCPEENGIKTFITKVVDGRNSLNDMIRGDIIPDFNLKNGYLDFAFKCTGVCQSCNKNQVHFLLHVFTTVNDENVRTITIQKVGVSPQVKTLPRTEVTKFFDRESNTWYFKGINAISENYGIGALAYFRRIIEKELIHIIEEIKELPDSHSSEIQMLLDEHNRQPSLSTIYENIFPHLPNSLKSLGDNPIRILYNQTSEGLHSMSETEAMAKANGIQQLLEFVILKINEERSNIKNLKDTIKALKG